MKNRVFHGLILLALLVLMVMDIVMCAFISVIDEEGKGGAPGGGVIFGPTRRTNARAEVRAR